MYELSTSHLRKLLQVSLEHNRPVTVDWVNRSISVLSEVKIHPTKVIYSGPVKYQDIIYRLQD
jgi:hypothetical protein